MEPYQVLATDDPARALAWIGEQEIHLVLSDLRMPGMSGDELLREIRRVSPSTVRVLITGYPGDGMVAESLEGCVECTIAKPWNDDELRATIQRLLRERDAARAGNVLADESATPVLERPSGQTDELLPLTRHRMVWIGPGRPALDADVVVDPPEVPSDVSLVAGPAAAIADVPALRLRTDPPRTLISANGDAAWRLPDDLEIRGLLPRVFHEIERSRAALQDSQSTRTRQRGWRLPDLAELAMRVECAGRSAREALVRMTDRFRRAELARKGLVLALDGIEALEDSVSRLLRATAVRVCVHGIRLSLLDPTRYLASFPCGGLPFRLVSPAGASHRYLWIHDLPEAAEFARLLFESAGHACWTAATASDAVEKMEFQAFDAVVLDLAFPGLEDVARYLRMRGDVRVVGLGAAVPKLDVSTRIDKPYSTAALLEAVS